MAPESGRADEVGRTVTGWRVAARLARREVRRRPWRTALVVTLVALPVAGMTFATIIGRTTTATEAESRAWTMGRADDVAYAPSVSGEPDAVPLDAPAFEAAVRRAYPAGSQVVRFSDGQDAVTDADGHLRYVRVSDRPLDEPLLEGTLQLTDGRPPRNGSEVVVSQTVLEQTGTEVGEPIELLLLGDVTVTGMATVPGCLTCLEVIGKEPPAASGLDIGHVAFVDAPPGFVAPDAEALRRINGYSSVLEGYTFDSDVFNANRAALIYLAGAAVLAAMAVIVAAAFAVAARRQLRTLGLLSASGVPPGGLRQTMLLQGATAGMVGSSVGVALGLIGVVAAYPFLDDLASQYVGSLTVHPLDLVVPPALGTIAATAAAWLPARTAAGVPVLAALAGRKPQGRLPVAIPLAGLAVAGLGITGLAAYARRPEKLGQAFGVVAVLAVIAGGVALAPWLVSHTEPLARFLRGGARVASRDLGRQRLRSGAVVAAVMVPAGLSVFVTTSAATQEVRDDYGVSDDYPTLGDQALVATTTGAARDQFDHELDEVRTILPGASEIDVYLAVTSEATGTGTGTGGTASLQIVDVLYPGVTETRSVVVNEPAQLAEADLPLGAVDALEDGKVVWLGDRPAADARITPVGFDAPVASEDLVPVDLDVIGGDNVVVISPETADRWGLRASYVGTLFRAPDLLSKQQRNELEQVFSLCDWGDPDCRDREIRSQLLHRDELFEPRGSVELVYPHDDGGRTLTLQMAVAGGSLAFTLLVVAVALALTSAESRDERALLEAVGAPPRIRRSITAWQAGLLPAMAMALAVPGGLAASLALNHPEDYYYRDAGVGLQIPWLTLGLLGVGVPLASAAVAWLGSCLTARRRRDLSPVALATD